MNLLPSFTGAPELNRVYHTDLFTLCDAMPSQSVDMILMDLPYGTTACHWDSVIPFEPMWARLKRIIKPRGAIVLTASQPFTSALVMSNPGMFRYEWVWVKNVGSNFLNAPREPMKEHESVLVFSDDAVNYYPQRIERRDKERAKYAYRADKKKRAGYGVFSLAYKAGQADDTRTPSSVLHYNRQTGLHFNQGDYPLTVGITSELGR